MGVRLLVPQRLPCMLAVSVAAVMVAHLDTPTYVELVLWMLLHNGTAPAQHGPMLCMIV